MRKGFQRCMSAVPMWYLSGWVVALLMIVLAFAVRRQLISFSQIPPCLFYRITGLYCFGCGGTRAVAALLNGKLLQSVCYHPIVVYAFAIYVWMMLKSTLFHCSGGKLCRNACFSPWYAWIAMGIIFFHMIFMNLAM